jgi:hypothetical protein
MQSRYSSALTNNSQTYCRQDYCKDTIYYYEAIQINVSTSGNYSIWSNSNIDTYGYIYDNSFNPSFPTQYLLLYDDGAGNGQFMFTMTLHPLINYILVATTFLQNTIGEFTIYATGLAMLSFSRLYITSKKSKLFYNNF